MSRRPARFTEADLYRAAKAAKRAGMAVEALADGTIRIVPERKPEQNSAPMAEAPPQPLC
jgi:hypothetical protein